MSSQRQSFFNHIAQTSPFPLALEIEKAEGMYLYDPAGKKYMDLISGIAVCNMGHANPSINKAIKAQVDKHMHVMVYGELIQSVQVRLAEKLCSYLPPSLNSVYFTNSGSEAVEGALKLAKRITGRTKLVAFKNSYHGSTQGSLSVCGNEELKTAFRPLLPGITILDYNDSGQLSLIDNETAAVIVEIIQAEAGIVSSKDQFLQKLAERCKSTGTLLIVDEIQTAMMRTGTLFAFTSENIVPDILLLGKGFGGGMPLGAFIASKENMSALTHDPVLGHLTTFGGHPVSCAAAEASLELITEEHLKSKILSQEKLFKDLLVHKKITEIRGKGLFLCLEFENAQINQDVIRKCLEKGLFTDWFLFAPHCLRIAPPLIISDEEIRSACKIIIDVLNNYKD
ncbi:MAG TPA: aminotransferase class III-fold pyridoxal phosphate-dependent enzyme [Bacteroidia bacterium]|nr:aminotransferase class III-fold pyridoxal phosphate-dependent enzyme [Bacteroidia bacterium]HNS11884.1 aminotransferase class III-fold pyridoxal phosphate-dependent enzyme [Bacteroidia bacterium]